MPQAGPSKSRSPSPAAAAAASTVPTPAPVGMGGALKRNADGSVVMPKVVARKTGKRVSRKLKSLMTASGIQPETW